MKKESGNIEKTTSRYIKEKTPFIALITVIFIVALTSIYASFTPLPLFCGVCHQGEYKTWKSSNHSKVSCNRCHRRQDFFSMLNQRISVLRMTGGLIANSSKTIRADVLNEVCRKCHKKEEQTVVTGVLKVSHKEIIDEGYECTFCHSKIVHDKFVPAPRITTKDKCLKCHNGLDASSNCDSCHTKDIRWIRVNFKGPWQIAHGKNWRHLHGTGNLESCNLCHQPSFCARCHGVGLPHPDAFMNLHGRIAKTKRKVCLACHKEQLCKNCHKLNLPHQEDFKPKHPRIVEKIGKKKCLKCHMEDGCKRCHTLHKHPGLSYERVKRLRKAAGLD